MALEEKRTAGESTFVETFFGGNLVLRIAIGIVAGIVLAFAWPDAAKSAMLLGNLFVNALKAVAPVLVLVLVASALANQKLSLIHISEPTRPPLLSRMPSSA